MNTNQLRYLIDISKTNSLNTTAKNMYVSQPSVSEAIHNLEKELNCTILTRSKRGVNLTHDGKLVLEYALQIMNQYRELAGYFQKSENRATGLLRVGVTSLMTEVLLQDVIIQIQESYPELSLHTKEMPASEIVCDVANGKIDFGVFGLSTLHENRFHQQFQEELNRLTVVPLFTDKATCVMHRHHPLAQKNRLLPEDIQSYRLTSLMMPDYADDYSPQYVHISVHAGIHKRLMQTQHTILPTAGRFADLLFPEKDYVFVPIEADMDTLFFLIYRKELVFTALERSFLEVVTETAQKL